MIGDLPKPGSRVFEIAFIVTAPLAVWIALGLVAEEWVEASVPRALGLPDRAVQLVVLAALYVGTWLAVRSVRRKRPGILATPDGYSSGEGVAPLVGWSVVAYAIVAVAAGTTSYLLVSRDQEHWGLVVWGLAIWLPMWFAVTIGTVVAWSRSRR